MNRIEQIQHVIKHTEAFKSIIDININYDIETIEFLIEGFCHYDLLSPLLTTLEKSENYKISGEHLISLLDVTIESKKELLEILKGMN